MIPVAGGNVPLKPDRVLRRRVVVNQIGHFPPPIAGVITLEPSVGYMVGDNITTDLRFILGDNCLVSGISPFSPLLKYTGTGTMFTAVDANCRMENIRLDCPNGKVLDISDTVGGAKEFLFGDIGILNCVDVADIDDLRAVSIDRIECNNITGRGFLFKGDSYLAAAITRSILTGSSSSYVGIDCGTSIHTRLNFSNLVLTQSDSLGVGISGLVDNGNIRPLDLATGSVSSITECEFNGPGTPLVGITFADIGWAMTRNGIRIKRSVSDGETYLSLPRTVVNPGLGLFTQIDGTDWVDGELERFTATNGGELEYIAEVSDDFLSTGTSTLEKVGGGFDQLAMRLAVNGTTLPKSQSVTESNRPTTVGSQGLLALDKNDVINLYVANLDSGASNTIVSDASLVVKG